ncbi:hypothetical protein [Streptomyces sp. H27-S2]|uniref:hypothetical protein n=1 Tax=Streptomyces antarcticus TaxID=2996458 RepID=UPI002270A949|nr:hypothetical protein [Streptomyces sp. H27-S2]MCY0954132.1 hypothetical protein [Streptomyces sp. H27-S2]
MTHNPAQYARVAADSLDRLVQDVRAGRAEWGHPHTVRQAAEDLLRVSDAMATVLQQMAAALDPAAPQTRQTAAALHLAGQASVTAATQLRTARRTLH